MSKGTLENILRYLQMIRGPELVFRGDNASPVLIPPGSIEVLGSNNADLYDGVLDEVSDESIVESADRDSGQIDFLGVPSKSVDQAFTEEQRVDPRLVKRVDQAFDEERESRDRL